MNLLPLHCETTVDALTAKHTAFKTLKEMAEAAGGYRPTLYVFRREVKIARFQVQPVKAHSLAGKSRRHSSRKGIANS